MMAKQKAKTKEYWDTFYADDQRIKNDGSSNPVYEWIVPNSPKFVDTILQAFRSVLSSDDKAAETLKVLEIGCGVSQLSRSLLQRLLKNQDGRAYTFVCTDISPVCIEKNRIRDDAFVASLSDGNGKLSYGTLDVLNPDLSPTIMNNYDIILDKGTLDTFLFRSKEKCSTIYPPLLTKLLNNVHRCLRSGCRSKYIIISPRSRIRSIRDFRGFASVRRTVIDTSSCDVDCILEKRNGKKQTKSTLVYLYECEKNDAHNPDTDVPYFEECPPGDESECPKCGLSFQDYL